ncbi:MAG: hypothetical protein AAGK14_06245 [Verrucomicrobiota bacterium]
MPARSDRTLESRARLQWAGLDWRVFFVIFAISLVVGLAYFALRPIYREWKRGHSLALAELSLRQLEQRQFYRSQSSAQEAFNQAPMHVPTLRLLARRATQVSPQEGLQLYLRILNLSGSTTQDAREAIELATRLGRHDIAIPLLDRLLILSPGDSECLHLASTTALTRGDTEGAITYARRARLVAPRDRKTQFLLAQALYRDPNQRDEARETLLEVSVGVSEQSLQALVELAKDPALPVSARQLVLRRLLRHPKAQWQHEVLAWTLQMQNLPPSERESYLQRKLESLKPRPEQLALIGRWLNSLNYPELTLRWLPAETARSSPELFRLRLDALAQQRQYRRIVDLLDDPTIPVDPTQRALYRARVAAQLGDPQVELLWGQLLTAARRHPTTQLRLAEQLEAINQPDLAFSIYEMMTQNPSTARYGFYQLLRYYQERRNTRGLWRTLERMAHAFPDNDNLWQQALYARFLLDEGDAKSVARSEKLVQQHPSEMSHRITLALAYLRQNRPADAWQLLDHASVRFPLLQPGWQAVYTATLSRNQQPERADQLREEIDLLRLSSEESALLHGL